MRRPTVPAVRRPTGCQRPGRHLSQTQLHPANPVTEPVDLFKVLSDPVRLDLYQRIIAVPEMSCTRLVDVADVSASTVSYHVKLLKTAGLVAARKQGRNYFYTGRVDRLDQLEHLFSELAATCRQNSAAPVAATAPSS